MFIQLNDAQFFTVSFGSAPRTLVAIGGWTGSWEVWADVFSHLSPTWRTIGIDHRGAGATIAPTANITVADMTADLLAVLDSLGIERCVLAAESAGAAVALSAAHQQPERFQGLALSGGLYYRPPSREQQAFLAGLRQDYEATVDYFIDNCLPETDDPAIYQWARKILLRASQTAAIDLYQSTTGLDLRQIVSRITTPTLIIHGSADRILPVESSHWLAAQMPHNRLQIIHNAGHAPMMTYPQDIAGAINDYFSDIIAL